MQFTSYIAYFFLQTSENTQNPLIKNIGERNISKSINSQKVASELKFYEDGWS